MKHVGALLLALAMPFSILADEGMWLPNLLKILNEKELAANGCKLTVEDIYSINKGSLKDAVVQFGGGCTGEVISDKGLVLTNHHCGFSQIQSHSSLENNYIRDGFWSKNLSEELPNPGLTVTFIKRIDDVTKQVLDGVNDSMSITQRDERIQANVKKLESESIAGTHYTAKVKSFFYGNEYYMFTMETFKDIRLVGAPPESIGNYGGDEDNWVWPRHTGDFSLFRIYAGKDNKPADYAADNVPYKPSYSFPISIKGVKENDFTMVFGFPGRTQEYLSSYAVSQILEIVNPIRIKSRKIRLDIWDKYMRSNELDKIKYASKYNRLSNYYKKWTGESKGLDRFSTVERKREFEKRFSDWCKADSEADKKYGKLLDQLKTEYEANNKLAAAAELFSESASGIELMTFANYFMPLYEKSKSATAKPEEFEAEKQRLKANFGGWFKNYQVNADREIAPKLLNLYLSALPEEYTPGFLSQDIKDNFKGDIQAFVNRLFDQSSFTTEEKAKELLDKLSKDNIKKLESDPAFELWMSLVAAYTFKVQEEYQRSSDRIAALNKKWMQAQRAFEKNKKFYPDANSTLRLSYGKIKGYEPKNGIQYLPFTTADGILEKAKDTSIADYKANPRLLELIKNKDFGPYGVKGKLPVAFCASNHTTGGNSGSPVLNAYGQLIGTNFDRNWDGTMSDISYDPDRVRNIIVDVRYTLFIIDKFAGAGHLVKEMKLVKE